MNNILIRQLQTKFMTVNQFVDYMNGEVSPSSIYKKIRLGIIPATKIGPKTYIPRDWVRKNYDEKIEAALAKVAE